jgi:RNA polymerase sigma factor (TIGR02999 family)
VSELDLQSLVSALERGEASAADAAFGQLYEELHRMARRELARRGAGVTLGATTLLHEAYIGMSGRAGTSFPDRARFMSYAARVMRGVIIDYARNRQAQKRGGLFEITSLQTDVAAVAENQELSALGEAVEALGQVDPGLAEVVDLKFFCGFTFAEIAAMRGVSERTVQRDWEKARIFLHQTLEPGSS